MPTCLALTLQAADAVTDAPGSTEDWLAVAAGLVRDHGPSFVAALLILVIGRFVAKVLTGALRRVLQRRGVDATLTTFTCSLLYMALLVLVVLSALERIGVKTTSFAAVVAAAGLAIGLALQGSLANFASGVMLIAFRPFHAGDFVEAGGVVGVVLEVGVFATVLRTGDNKRIVVPNSSITDGTITNYSAHDTRRVDLVFGIGYDDDLREAKRILEAIVASEERILKEPEPVIAVGQLADSSVNLLCRPWVKTEDYWEVTWHLLETVKLEFDARGISIPFPQTDVHLHRATEGEAA